MTDLDDSAQPLSVGWIGLGRMGEPMAGRLLKAGYPLSVWNRTASKASALAAGGARVAASPSQLADCDVVFTMVSTGADLQAVCFGEDGLFTGPAAARPRVLVDCSSIAIDESAAVRSKLEALDVAFVAAPVSGNGKCVKAGKLSCVMSGPADACERVRRLIHAFAPAGIAYVGEGELARVCKIAHNVLLAVVIENLIEVTLLAEKAGVPRHAFLQFMNDSVMGSTFTRYKSPALVNLDYTTTFTPELLRKDVDLGMNLAKRLGVFMPVTSTTRDVLQSHFGAATLQPDAPAYLAKDFTTLIETLALASGMRVSSENRPVPTGLETQAG